MISAIGSDVATWHPPPPSYEADGWTHGRAGAVLPFVGASSCERVRSLGPPVRIERPADPKEGDAYRHWLPRGERQGLLARLAQTRGVLRASGRHQHPDVRRSAEPLESRPADGRPGHGRRDGCDGD